MEKIIKIGKQPVKLSNNVAWTMEYRDQFGKDIVPTMMPLLAAILEGVSAVVADSEGNIDVKTIADSLQGRAMEVVLPLFQMEFVDTIVNVTWAMAKAADESITPPKQWVRQFEDFPLDVVVPALYDLVLKGFVSSKNLKRLKSVGASLKNLQPSPSMTLSSQDSNED